MSEKNTLEDTSSSFRPKPAFNYHHKEKSIEWKLLRGRQVDQIKQLFDHGRSVSQEKVLTLFERMNIDNNLFIQTLLDEIGSQCTKIRLGQDSIASQLRNEQIQKRRLCEEVINLQGCLKTQKAMDMKARQQLQRDLRWEKTIRKELEKELKGVKALLQQYENELGQKNKELKVKEEEGQLVETIKSGAEAELVSLCDQLQKVASQKVFLESENSRFTKQLDHQKEELAVLKHQIESYINTNEDLEKAQTQMNKTLQELAVKQTQIRLYQQEVQDLKENLKDQQQKYQLEISTKNKTDAISEDKIQQLQQATKKGMEALKLTYNKKLRMLTQLLTKEVHQLKSLQAETKDKVQKELLLFWRLSKMDIRQSVALG